jgi:integrase
MGRKATGTVRILKNDDGEPAWHAKWTRADGKPSPWLELPDPIPVRECCDTTDECEHRRQAKALAARMAPKIRIASSVNLAAAAVETVEQYATRWSDWREARGLSCVKDDRARLKNHVLPTLGPLDVTTVTRRDLEKLVEKLDERISAGELGWKVATMAWANVTRMFKDACSAKKLDLRVRESNPADGVQGPERGAKKEKQYLWPSEFVTLMSEARVPRRWRRLFAIAVYAYARAGEIEALRWEDVSFDTMTIHIHQSVDRVRKRGTVKSTKTGVSRRIPIEAELYPLLKAMHDDANGKGKVIDAMPSPGMLSRKLKVYLERAGVKRAELFATDATRKAITFHDLRATGLTWMAARGDDPLRIKQRAGHSSFQTTEGYIREAENLGANFGEVFPSLPVENIVPNRPGTINPPEFSGNFVGATGFEDGQRRSEKASRDATLAKKSRKTFGKPLPSGSARSRPVPHVGAELRQPEGNTSW